MNEEELLQQLGWMRAMAGRLVADPEAADDVLQRACLLALQKGPDRHTGGPGLRAWLTTTTRRLASHSVRAAGRRRRHETAAPPADGSTGPGPSADEDAARRELLRLVTEAVLALDEPSFAIIADRYYAGLEVREIAERRGLTQAAVRQRLSRARRALRARLKQDVDVGWTPLLVVTGWLAHLEATGAALMAHATWKAGVFKLALVFLLLGALSFPLWNRLVPATAVAVAPVLPPAAEAAEATKPAPAGAVLPARSDAAVTAITPPAPAVTEDVSATPASPARVTGRIVDAQGRAVEGADVLFGWNDDDLWDKSWDFVNGRIADIVPRATSDAEGRFLLVADLAGKPPEEVAPRLVISHASHGLLAYVLHDLTESGFDAGDIALPAGAALAGRVVNEAGAPVAGAWLQVRPVPDAPPASTESAEASPWFLRQRTTNEGGFRISGLRSGRLDLTIQAPGRGGAQLDELRLDAPGTLDLGEIVLPDGHALAGRVVDTEGQPIGGANISVNSDDGPGAMVATDAEGQFRVPGLASGLYSLHASERGHAWTRVFDVPAGTEDLRIVMPRYGSLEVRVLDHETGTPIADATVEASLPLAERYHPWSAFQFRVESGDAGADGAAAEPGVHRVWGAGAQGTELTVSAKDYITARIDAPGVRDGEMREVDVILRRGLVLAGRVVDADGAPIGGARVIAEARTEAHTLAADDEGRFRFGMLSDGAWRLVAEASGYHAAAPLEVVMQADTPLATVTLGMFQASRIEGVVYGPSGSPRPGCRVVATPRVPAGFDARERRLLLWYAEPGDPYGLWHATTDAAGRYVLSDLPPGRYAAWVSRGEQDQEFAVLASLAPDEAWDAACRSADAAAGTTTTLDIVQPAPATLHGRVIAGNLPQAGAAVALIYADVEYTNKLPPHPVALVETDELGRFEIGDLVPHRYALVALVTDSPVPAVQLVQPRAGERLHRELHVGGADAVVTVTERPQGTPVAGARLNLRPMRFTDGHPGQELWEPQFAWFVRTLLRETDRLPFGARSDAEGRFRLRHLPPGEYHVRVEGNPYLPAELQLLTVPATGHPDVMAFDLVRGAVIEGTVTTAGLTRYSALDVRLFRADGWYVGTSSIVDGRFRFEGLDAGTFSVRIQDGPDLATTLAAQEVTLGAGQQREIALRVDG